jgi:hypothetical protein
VTFPLMGGKFANTRVHSGLPLRFWTCHRLQEEVEVGSCEFSRHESIPQEGVCPHKPMSGLAFFPDCPQALPG